MLGFIEKLFTGLLSDCTIGRFGDSLAFNSNGPIKCVSLNNLTRKARATHVNINSNKTRFYRFTVSVNKCGESCDTIDDPYARGCVAHKVRNVNLKVSTLMLSVNEVKRFS